jgi:hypothetical protein
VARRKPPITDRRFRLLQAAAGVKIDRSKEVTYIEAFFGDWKTKDLRKYVAEKPFQLQTDGAVIESKGKGGTTLEIIDFQEFKSRFPGLATGTHFCVVSGIGTGKQHCVPGNCPGVCTLQPWPIYCTCD